MTSARRRCTTNGGIVLALRCPSLLALCMVVIADRFPFLLVGTANWFDAMQSRLAVDFIFRLLLALGGRGGGAPSTWFL